MRIQKKCYLKEQATAASKRTKAAGGRKMRSVVITRSSGPEVLEPQDVEDPGRNTTSEAYRRLVLKEICPSFEPLFSLKR